MFRFTVQDIGCAVFMHTSAAVRHFDLCCLSCEVCSMHGLSFSMKIAADADAAGLCAQVGKDREAQDFLASLDKHPQVGNMIDCTRWGSALV